MAKFEHQQFEEWLFSSEPVSSVQTLALHEHLLTCVHCRELTAAWQGVEHQLMTAPTVSPSPGFTERWQARLIEERIRRGNRQVKYFLAFSLGGAVLLLGILAYLIWPVIQSPYPIILALAVRITSAFTTADHITSTLSTLLTITLRVIPPTLWVGSAVALFSLCIVWIFILRKVVLQHRSLT
jgi:hypothetical protein